MKNRNRKIVNILLTAAMAVSSLYANAQQTQVFNSNWEETLTKLVQSDITQIANNEFDWEDEITPDSVAFEEPAKIVIEDEKHCKSELSTWVAGGLSTLNYQPTFGDKENGFGGTFGLGYTHYFSENWALQTGVELSLHQSKFSQNKLHDNYNTMDLDPYVTQEMNFRYRVDSYKESQQLYNLNIPLMLQYQTKKQGNHRFFVAGGVKLGIPISEKYESKNATVDSRGYYYDWHQTLNEPTSLGYGVFENQSAKGKSDFGLSAVGSLETGIKWELRGGINLYTGVYADYGLNDIVKKHNDKFVVYDSYESNDFTQINSVLTSQYTNNNRTMSFTNKVSPMAVGFKLRLGFSVSCPVREKVKAENLQHEFSPLALETLRQSTETVQKLTDVIQKQATEIVDKQEISASERSIEKSKTAEKDINIKDIVTINYDVNIATLTAEQQKMLDEYIVVLQNNPSAKIILTGHACNLGNYAGNMRIGQKRADLAKAYMMQKGVQAERILTFSKGNTEPLCLNINEVNQKKNRRLEVQIIR